MREDEKKKTMEDELDEILSDYAELEHRVDNLLIVLNSFQERYDRKNMREEYATINVIMSYLSSIQTDFSKTITKMDLCIMEEREKWRQQQDREEVVKKC